MTVRILVALIKAYKRWVSPVLGPSCRFYPSCSSYAIEALEKYGIGKGLILTGIRLLKCQPLHPGGYDPVE